MILVIALVYAQISRKTRDSLQEKQFTYGVIGAGGLSLLVMLYEYISTMSELRRDPLGIGRAIEDMINFQFGAIMSLLGSIAVSVGGFLHLGVDVRTVVSQPTASPPTMGEDPSLPTLATANAELSSDHPPPLPTVQKRVCPQCGSQLRPHAVFCGNCGVRV
jgi:hypothetical protein